MDTKSRFSTLRLFRLNGSSGHNTHTSESHPPSSLSLPPPPPKDRDNNSNFFLYTSSSTGAASTPDLSYNSMRSLSNDYPRFQSPVSPFIQQTSTSASTSSLVSPATALRKGLTKLSSLGRRVTKSTNIPHSPSLNVLPECNDEGISAPYNFQHNIHVNDNLQGMPPSWVTTLQAAGFTEEEINRLRVVGRQRAATHSAGVTATIDSTGTIAATFPGNYMASGDFTPPFSQFGELYRSPTTLNPSSQNTHHPNPNNPSRSISILSSSVRSSSPSHSRESLSPSLHATQQPMLSPTYTQHFTGHTPSSHSHQSYTRSDYADRMTQSHSPTETSSRAPTEAATYSRQSISTSDAYSRRHGDITPPINTYNTHPIYRVVNEDPTPTTPPPAYASPHSAYRSSEKGPEKAFRWDISFPNTQGEGPSGFEANTSSVVPSPAAVRSSTYKPPIQSGSPPYRSIHVTNQASEADLTPSSCTSKESPLLSSNDPLSSTASQAETVLGRDRRDDVDTDDTTSLKSPPSRTSSPVDDPLRLDTPTKSEGLINCDSVRSSVAIPSALAAPPRLSLHTDQDDDWSTILKFSFSDNNMSLGLENNNHSPQGNPLDQSQDPPIPTSSSLTSKSNRASRRSIVYGPRGFPAKEKLSYHSTKASFSSTVGSGMVTLDEREESYAAVNFLAQGGLASNGDSPNEDWVDNYLDMKDGDYEDFEGATISKDNWSQEKPISRRLSSRSNSEHGSSVNLVSPIGPVGSSPKKESLPPHSSLSYGLTQQDGTGRGGVEVATEKKLLTDAISHELTASPPSEFTDLEAHPSLSHIIRHSLSSSSPSQHISVLTSNLAPSLSPSTSIFSPTLSPKSAMRPTSILSRRSFELPPPLPPPEDDLPPTPMEAAAMGLMGISPAKRLLQGGTQSTQVPINYVDNRNEQDIQRPESPVSIPISSRQSSQRLLTSTSTTMPDAPFPKPDLPPVPPRVSTEAKHTHMPMSSISSMSSHSRSASGHYSSSAPLTAGRPPPLPMPPTGKVLPSVIMQQRRAAAINGDTQLLRSTTISGLPTRAANVTPSPSTSTFSHSSKSAYSSDTSETSSVSDKRGQSTVHEDSNTIRATDTSSRIVLQTNEVSLLQLKGTDSSGCVVDAKDDEIARIRSTTTLREGNGWISDNELSAEDVQSNGQENTSLSDMIQSHADSVVEPSTPAPLTPSIAVNGLTVPTRRDPSLIFDEPIHQSSQICITPEELPLVLYPIKEYIFTGISPLNIFFELQEIAQGQYGSVYMAQVRSEEDDTFVVAVKKVPVPIKGTPKIGQLKRELTLLSKIRHKHILETEALFYEPVESMLWIQMELMERSLADILALGEEGLEIEEQMIARFASDVLLALAYLNEQGISHRDLRSDNLLINSDGILKLADLSNAVQVPRDNSIRLDIVGIHHWQAPEIRSGRYDALKVDVWSLGATVWECAEFAPPFSDVEDPNALGVRWPTLSRADEFSKDFHDFLRLCSEPAVSRPSPSRLLRHPCIQTACPRVDVLSLLNLCRSIEDAMRNGD